MSTKAKKALRAIPKVLAEELAAALKATDPIGDERPTLLARLRRNRAKSIAAWGICNIGKPVADLEAIPIESLADIQRLDAAFSKLYHYTNGGAGDYAAKDVESVINKNRASGSRKARDEQQKEILDFLLMRDYPNQENQKAIRIAATERFDVSERTVSRAIEKGGIAKQRNNP